jgi:ABC-2 type transport system permease protein
MTAARAVELLAAVGRESVRQARSPRYLVLALGVPLTQYLLYTRTPIAGPVADRTVSGASWATHFMVSMAALGAIAAALSVGVAGFSAATANARRIRSVAATGLLVMPPLALVGLAGAFLNGVRLDGATWLDLALALWIGAAPFVALGLLLATVLDRDVAGVVLLGVLILLAVLGGLLQPLETLPQTMLAIAPVLPSYHLAALGWMAIVGRGPSPVDVVVLAGYTAVVTAVLWWRGHGESTDANGRARGE